MYTTDRFSVLRMNYKSVKFPGAALRIRGLRALIYDDLYPRVHDLLLA